jgi:xylulokinase
VTRAVQEPVVIGVDIGTGSTKGVLATPSGEVIATARRAHRMSLPRPGWAEMDAERDFWAGFAEVTRELMTTAGGREIAGVCVSGIGPCVLRVDGSGAPRHAAILYGIDMRATAEIAEMTERLGADAVLKRCGKDLSTQAAGPKLLWLQRNLPEAWDPADHWHSAHTYVVERLAGEWVMDHQTASQCDPLYDVEAQAWADDWAEMFFPGMAMPRLVWPAEQVGAVLPAAAALTGLPAGTPVMAGTIDAWAEAYSAGVRRPGDLMLMYGSTMFMVQVVPAFTVAGGLWTTSGVEPGSHTLAAGMATSGSLTGWVQELTGGASFDELVEEAKAVPPGSDGLVVLPYFAGERSPIFDPQARGVVAGLSLRHQRGHLFRAVYEGIACGIRQIIDALDSAAGPPLRVVAVGGGTQGGLWTRIVSDVTGLAQHVPAETIGASYGAALMASVGTGLVPPETDWARTVEIVEPDPSTRRVYTEVYRTYTELYPATRDQVHTLARLQGQA